MHWHALVAGWLQISPKSDIDGISKALSRANSIAYVATSDPFIPALVTNISGNTPVSVDVTVGPVRQDEACSPPIFNYSRTFSWMRVCERVAALYEVVADKAIDHITVDEAREWKLNQGYGGRIVDENRIGSLQQIMSYCGGGDGLAGDSADSNPPDALLNFRKNSWQDSEVGTRI